MTSEFKTFLDFIRSFTQGSNEVKYKNVLNQVLHQSLVTKLNQIKIQKSRYRKFDLEI
jgi:hypothetical protein